MESSRATAYAGLLSLDGAQVTDGRFTATTSVDLVSVGLMRIEVGVTCDGNADVNTRLVALVADKD